MTATHNMKSSLLVAMAMLSFVASAIADPGHKHGANKVKYSAGSPGDPKKPSRMILVTMNETDDGRMIYAPAKFVIRKGEQIRFVITNAGKIPHEFVLANTEENLKHAEEMKKFPEMGMTIRTTRPFSPSRKQKFCGASTKAERSKFPA